MLVFGLIALCTAYGEGAMADWGALHLSQDLAAGPGTAAAGYAVFALAMTIGRLTGTTVVQRFGAARALIAGGTTATAGLLLGALAPTAWTACAGFAVAGLGLANIFPIAIARAGETGGPDGVAVASTVGYGGMLLGPPAIGFLAEAARPARRADHPRPARRRRGGHRLRHPRGTPHRAPLRRHRAPEAPTHPRARTTCGRARSTFVRGRRPDPRGSVVSTGWHTLDHGDH